MLILSDDPSFLDLATGSGDQLLSHKRLFPAAKVTGLDISEPMLELAKKKIKNSLTKGKISLPEPTLILGQATEAPLPDESFDSISISFGLRNITDRRGLYSSAYRMLKPGGRLLILELFFDPRSIWAPLYRFHLDKFTPFLASLLGGRGGAYRYLARSVLAFPHPATIITELKKAGFVKPQRTSFTFGVCMLVWAHKPF
jgi:demethylmenaquinone methyltransferase/2-methoxy-6-polyprenyl-1,4-benzoquinol methylase